MRKINGSIIALNRKAFLLLSVMLSLAVFGILTWRINAQRVSKVATANRDISTLSPAKLERYLLDQQHEAQMGPVIESAVQPDAPDAVQANPVIFAYDFFSDSLVSFNANTPDTILTNIPVTGLDTANNEFISGIDYRPSGGLLYGTASKGFPGTDRVVTINTATGAVTSVAANTVATTIDSFTGLDFNPTVDRIRQVGDADNNRRLNPVDGTLAGTDTNLAYVAGDPGFGTSPNIVHVAYSNNTPTATTTTMYGIDSDRNTLVRIGGPNGTPSPNTGQVTTIGALGVNPTAFGGFDIQQGTDLAYASLFVDSTPTLYRINLATGAATLLGVIGDGTLGIDGLAIPFSATGGSANLGITKTDGVATVTPGSTTTYTIVASNAGPDPVVGATVTDTFPAGISGATWTCVAAGGGSCPAASGTGNISALVSLPSGGSVTFSVVATIAANATGTVANTATVAAPAGVTDPTPGNNSATDTNTVPAPTPTPTPTPAPTATPTPTPAPTATPTPTPAPTATPTPTPAPTATPTPTPAPTATPTPTPTPTTFVAFSSATYRDDESQSAVITINRTGVVTGTSTVTFSTVAGGTATAGATCVTGADYQTTTQVVNFAANATSATVSVPLCGDLLVDVNETVNLALSNASSGTGVIAPTSAVLTINDTANQFRNTAAISIIQGTAAGLYPSPINVTGATTNVFRVRVTLYDLYTASPDNLDVLLVSPTGAKYVVVGDVGGPAAITESGAVTLTLADFPAGVLPDAGPLATGAFKPTSCETPVTNFPAPAPVGPYVEPGCVATRPAAQTLYGTFAGATANGVWNLYVRDDNGVARPLTPEVVNGEVKGGWGIELLPSTAAGVEVSGRVTTSDGRGVRNATVIMTDQYGIQRTAITGSFGYYRFEDVEVGSSLVLSIKSRRYAFGTRVVQVFDTLADVDFIAQE